MKTAFKKSLALVLAAVMLLCALPFTASAATSSGTCGTNLTWSLDIDTGVLNITGTGAMKNYSSSSFPPWYSYRSNIKTVNIASGVTTIGERAFYNCTSLTSVTIGNSVTTIGNYAFYYCDSLTSVTIPDSVTSIGNEAFYNCYSLTSVTIPDSVTTIGELAFYWCDSLTNIKVASDNKYYSSDSYGVLFNKDKTILIQYPVGNTRKNYTIPDSVATIGECAFFDCISLTSVTIGNSVITIGYSAFRYCDSLTSVTIPDGVTTIGSYAFDDCDSLTSVTIGNSVTTIGSYAFDDCDSLTSITIPDNVTTIGNYAFAWCDSLTSVTILDNVTSIGEYAFAYCYYLRDYNIPAGATVGYGAFYQCGTKVPAAKTAKIDISNTSYSCIVGEKFYISGDIESEGNLGDITLTWTSGDGVKLYTPASVINSSANSASFSIEAEGIKEGTYTVTVSGGGASDSCTVNVEELMIGVEIKLARDSYTNINGALKTKSGSSVSSVDATVVLKNNMTEKALENIELDLLLTDPNVYSGLSFEKNSTKTTKSISVDSINPGETKTIELKLYPYENKFSSNTEIHVDVTVDGEFVDTYKSKPIALNYKIISYGIKDSRAEVFSFSNSESAFVGSEEKSKYLISSDSLGKVSLVDRGDVYLNSTKNWGGSCYGMSAMAVAFEHGWSNTSDYGSSYVNSFEAPVSNTSLRDAINIMQCTQTTIRYASNVDVPNVGKTQATKRKELVAAVKNISNGGNVPVLHIKESKLFGGSHAVVAFNIVEKGNNYLIYIADPNYPSMCGVVTIAKDYSTFSYDLGSNYNEIKYVVTNSNVLDINSYLSSPIARMSKTEEQYDFTMMTVSDFDELTIENASGKKAKISYTEGTVEGDLEVYVDTVAGAGTGVLKIIIKDNPYETNVYKVKSSIRGMNITVNNNHIIADAVVTDDATLYYASNGVARLEGLNNSKFELSVVDGTNLAATEMLLTTVNGENANNVEMKLVGDKVKVSGDNLEDSELTVVKDDDVLTKETSDIGSNSIVAGITDGNLSVKDEEKDIELITKLNIMFPSTTSINYGETLVLQLEDVEVPEGYKIEWSVIGDAVTISVSEDGKECRVTSTASGNVTVRATVVDENGEPIINSIGNEIFTDINIKSNAGFWQKLVSFFKNLFRINRIIY